MSEDLIKLYQTMSGVESISGAAGNALSKPAAFDGPTISAAAISPSPTNSPSDPAKWNNASSANSMLKFGSRSYSSNAVVTKVISANNSPVLHNVQVVKSPLSYLNLTEYLSKTTPSPLAISEPVTNPPNSILSVPLHQNELNCERFGAVAREPVKKRKREKCNKGLRHFSMKVCEKVKQKGVTSYNEVADELVAEYCSLMSAHMASVSDSNSIDSWYDQKNVRRRVYDALNVLMAMNIISKEKKEIKWIGLPCNKKQECADLESEKKTRMERIQVKCDQLKDLLLEQIAIKSLIERNVRNELTSDQSSTSWSKALQEQSLNQPSENAQESVVSRLKLPFIVINTDNRTVIDCSISDDKKEYVIQLDNTFQINSHIDVLKKLGLTNGLDKMAPNESQDENYIMENDLKLKKACSMLPKIFEPYIKQMTAIEKIEPVCDPIDVPNYKELIRSQNAQNINKYLKTKSMRHSSDPRSSRKKLCTLQGLKKSGNTDNGNESAEDNESSEFNSLSTMSNMSKPSTDHQIAAESAKEFMNEDDVNDGVDDNSFDNSNEDEFDDELEEQEDEGEDEFDDGESEADDDDDEDDFADEQA